MLPILISDDLSVLHIDDVLTKANIMLSVKSESKKHLLDIISLQFAKTYPSLNKDMMLDELVKRERLGTTALGHGVAIPHIRLDTEHQPLGVFIQLETPIEFDAQDQQPVDLVFALLVPKSQCDNHLHLLSEITNALVSYSSRQALREAKDTDDILSRLSSKHHAQETA